MIGAVQYRVDFLRHGRADWIVLETRVDAEAFVVWGQYEGSAFIDAVISEVRRDG